LQSGRGIIGLSPVQVTELIADRLVRDDRVLAGARVAVADGRIVSIDSAAATGGPAALTGTLLPGFVDLQVNGTGGASVDTATPDALEQVANSVFAGGAVAFLPTLITAPWEQLLAQVAAVSAWIDKWSGQGAEPLGLHVEGPFLAAAGAHDAACFLDPTPQRIDALLAAGGGRVRLVTLANSRAGAAAAVARLHKAGVAVAIGHVDDPTGLPACVDAGATLVTHLFNAMGNLHHREANVAGLALDEPRLSCSLIVDGEHVAPATLRTAFAVLGVDRTVLVSDAVSAAGMPDGTYALAGSPVHLKGGVVRNSQGVLAGSALTMAAAARNFLRLVPNAGVWSLARIAAANPARLIGNKDYGELSPGRRAAFTLLGDDGSVRAVRG
jgi:N-acetylglucosamine-6-phosphate deacetylase